MVGVSVKSNFRETSPAAEPRQDVRVRVMSFVRARVRVRAFVRVRVKVRVRVTVAYQVTIHYMVVSREAHTGGLVPVCRVEL